MFHALLLSGFLSTKPSGPLPCLSSRKAYARVLAMRKMAMSLDFVIMEVATKKKVQDDRRGYFLHSGYFLSLLLCPKLENLGPDKEQDLPFNPMCHM
jgi:hypothetical protein